MKKLLLVLAVAAACQTVAAKGMDVDDAWARETVQGMSMGGVFLEIDNETGRDDVLVGGKTSVADAVEVHQHIMDGGVMKMRPVEGGIPLPAGKQTDLKPGSYHIMLMGLKKPLKAGDKFPLTLKFGKAKPKTVKVKVRSNAGGMAAQHSHDDHDHEHHDHEHQHEAGHQHQH